MLLPYHTRDLGKLHIFEILILCLPYIKQKMSQKPLLKSRNNKISEVTESEVAPKLDDMVL